jgi:uncharacterized protein YndB with AHSA1/START domain
MKITVETTVKAPADAVWQAWINPDDIMKWNAASDDWHTTAAEIDLRVGGRFSYRMEAKDGSMGFDFEGTYDQVIEKELISYKMTDGRKVDIEFTQNGNEVSVSETFDAEGTNSDEQQREGWQAILGNFKKYVESKEK